MWCQKGCFQEKYIMWVSIVSESGTGAMIWDGKVKSLGNICHSTLSCIEDIIQTF